MCVEESTFHVLVSHALETVKANSASLEKDRLSDSELLGQMA